MNQPKAVNVQPMAVAVISGDNILVTAKKWFLVKSAVTRICPRVPTLRLLFVQGTIIVGTGINLLCGSSRVTSNLAGRERRLHGNGFML